MVDFEIGDVFYMVRKTYTRNPTSIIPTKIIDGETWRKVMPPLVKRQVAEVLVLGYIKSVIAGNMTQEDILLYSSDVYKIVYMYEDGTEEHSIESLSGLEIFETREEALDKMNES